MKKRTHVVLFLISVLFPIQAHPARTDADEIVRKLRKKYESIKTLQVQFVQTIYWSLADEEQAVSGTLYLAAGNKYRVETDNQIIVTNGKIVWTYSRDRNQVIISALENSKENPLPRDLMLKYTRESRYTLVGQTRINGRDCYELVFIPKKEDEFLVRTRVWVDKKTWLAVKIEQEDINENITRYELKDFKINLPLSPDLFEFTVQKDMEVVDLR